MTEQGNKQDKREKLLNSALAAYTRYGIQEATTRQIADIAGIGKSTIFEYFKTSTELMDEAFAYYIADANSQWQQLHSLAQDNPLAALTAYLDSITALTLSDPGRLLLISQYVTTLLARHRGYDEIKQEYAQRLRPMADKLLDEFLHIAHRGLECKQFLPAAGMDAGDCATLMIALSREIQSHALTLDYEEAATNCRRLKALALRLLGVY